MYMTKIKTLKQELEQLKTFVRDEESYCAEQIYNWVSDCVAFFASIGMNESIITGFMSTFEYKSERLNKSLNLQPSEIGPFTDKLGGYKLAHSIFDYDSVHKKSVYLKIAFTTADKIIENLEDVGRLVPKPLLEFFKSRTGLSHISSSLELMKQNCETKDSAALLDNVITLLESIFVLESDLVGKKLSQQINTITNEPTLSKKFGDIRSEIFQAFHNFRMLRNQLGSHKSVPIQYDMPFAVSLSAAYLAIMFLQLTMATGEVVK